MTIKISKMTGKLKGIEAINTNPLTNNFCIVMHNSQNKNIICTKCYSCYMLNGYRKNCIPAFENNSIELSTKPLENIPKLKENNVIRINAHGELINELHLHNILKIINAYKNKIFSLYTKRKDIIENVFSNTEKPKNLILVYSNPIIDEPITEVPKYFDKVFNVCKNKYLDKINCGALSCNSCRKCYDINKENIIYEKIK